MMNPDEIQTTLEGALSGASVVVTDTTGTRDHFHVEVIAPQFAGKSLIEQHRMVQEPLQAAITDGRIHALSIKTATASKE